jgi:hypothetical protein
MTLGPALAIVAVVICMLSVTAGTGKADWRLPAAASAALMAFSVLTIALEGPTGFWPNHTLTLWGNQVWYDLLLAVAIGWTLLLPRMRAQQMQDWPWLILVVTTASIGLLACLARLQWLEARR